MRGLRGLGLRLGCRKVFLGKAFGIFREFGVVELDSGDPMGLVGRSYGCFGRVSTFSTSFFLFLYFLTEGGLEFAKGQRDGSTARAQE